MVCYLINKAVNLEFLVHALVWSTPPCSALTNTLATFQAYINRALARLVDCFYVVYPDNILIYSNSRKEHVRHLYEVLARLRKFGLYTSRKKCDFFVTEVEFLSYIVTGAQIDMRFSGHVTAMPAGVASIPTAPSWRAACVLRARLRRPDC